MVGRRRGPAISASGTMDSVSSPARLRLSRTALLPVVVLFLCFVPLAAVSPWTALVLLVPLALAAWVLRVGVDVGEEGVTVRSLAGARAVPWADLAGIRVGPRGHLWLVTTRGSEVRLPVLRPRDLPRLAALSGGRIPAPGPAAAQ
jgi:Bacterial PH domain